MNCPACNTENPDDAQFCSQCGGSLTPEQEQDSGVHGTPEPKQDAGAQGTSEPEHDAGAQDVSQPQQNAGPQETPTEPPDSAELALAYQAMEFAGFQVRLGAFAIDFVIVAFVTIAIALFLGPLAVLLVWPAYFIYLTAKSGQTLGKRVVGLKVVDHAGEVPRPRRLINRELYRFALLYFVSPFLNAGLVLIGWIFLAVFITGHMAIFFDPLRRTWHDRLGRTYVVRVSRASYIPPPR